MWVALALLGASAGLGVADAWGRARARGAPDGWRRVASPARYASPARLGELRLDGRAWALQFNEALVADAPSSRVEVTVSVGALGRVLVAPAADGGSPPAFVLARGERPRFVANGAPIACEGELPPVEQAPYTLRVVREGDRWVARAADGVLRCAGPADGPPRVQAGVRRVHVRALADARGPVAPPLGFAAGAACVLLGALGGCVIAWVDRRAAPAMLAVYAPLALGVLGFGADIGPLLSALRVEPTPVPVAALGVGLAVLGRGAVAAWALARRDAPPPVWLVAASGLPAAAAVYFGSGQRLLPATLLVAAGIPLGARALQWACTGVPHGWGAGIVGATAGAAGLSAIGLADPVARLRRLGGRGPRRLALGSGACPAAHGVQSRLSRARRPRARVGRARCAPDGARRRVGRRGRPGRGRRRGDRGALSRARAPAGVVLSDRIPGAGPEARWSPACRVPRGLVHGRRGAER